MKIKKNRKDPEAQKKEIENNLYTARNAIKNQIIVLETKRDGILRKAADAKAKGLVEQEGQCEVLLRQILASIKREQGLLMTLELAVESRDLAKLNTDFLESISTLSEDIINSNGKSGKAEARKIGDRYMRAVEASDQRMERINDLLAMGDYTKILDNDNNAELSFEAKDLINNYSEAQKNKNQQ